MMYRVRIVEILEQKSDMEWLVKIETPWGSAVVVWNSGDVTGRTKPEDGGPTVELDGSIFDTRIIALEGEPDEPFEHFMGQEEDGSIIFCGRIEPVPKSVILDRLLQFFRLKLAEAG